MSINPKHLLFSLLLLVATNSLAKASTLTILDPLTLDHWQSNRFVGETQYSKDIIQGKPCIKAQSTKSASGLYREISVDLQKTPFLNWHWRIDHTLGNIDESSKEYDDYAARIYIVISGGLFFWRTRALSYVWANQHTVGEHWPNAYSDNAIMIAIESGNQNAGLWQSEKRNIYNDIKKYLNIETDTIDMVAFMTDTDNTGKTASACYGKIFFSQQ